MAIPRAIIPVHPAQFSAYGFIMTNARVDRQRTTQFISTRFDPQRANRILFELVEDCLRELTTQGYESDIVVTRALEMRYLGQNYELELILNFERFEDDAVAALWTLFHNTHQSRFGFSTPGEIIEIVTFSVTAVAKTQKPELADLPDATCPPDRHDQRNVWFVGGAQLVSVFQRKHLRPGHELHGPALIEEDASVTVLDAGHRLRLHRSGHLLIEAVE
jgi:N-methylhydantoinase A